MESPQRQLSAIAGGRISVGAGGFLNFAEAILVSAYRCLSMAAPSLIDGVSGVLIILLGIALI